MVFHPSSQNITCLHPCHNTTVAVLWITSIKSNQKQSYSFDTSQFKCYGTQVSIYCCFSIAVNTSFSLSTAALVIRSSTNIGETPSAVPSLESVHFFFLMLMLIVSNMHGITFKTTDNFYCIHIFFHYLIRDASNAT